MKFHNVCPGTDSRAKAISQLRIKNSPSPIKKHDARNQLNVNDNGVESLLSILEARFFVSFIRVLLFLTCERVIADNSSRVKIFIRLDDERRRYIMLRPGVILNFFFKAHIIGNAYIIS